MKVYKLAGNIGRAKYVVSYHDGIKKHNDGSPFYDIAIFKNKVKMNSFVKSLIDGGYLTEGEIKARETAKAVFQMNMAISKLSNDQ